jgi:hypothetical protein
MVKKQEYLWEGGVNLMNQKLIKVMEERKADVAAKINEYEDDIKNWEEERRLADNLRVADDFKLNEDEKESLEYEALALGDLIIWRQHHLAEQQQELRLVEMKIKFLKQTL